MPRPKGSGNIAAIAPYMKQAKDPQNPLTCHLQLKISPAMSDRLQSMGTDKADFVRRAISLALQLERPERAIDKPKSSVNCVQRPDDLSCPRCGEVHKLNRFGKNKPGTYYRWQCLSCKRVWVEYGDPVGDSVEVNHNEN
jgi:hypothetical protein